MRPCFRTSWRQAAVMTHGCCAVWQSQSAPVADCIHVSNLHLCAYVVMSFHVHSHRSGQFFCYTTVPVTHLPVEHTISIRDTRKQCGNLSRPACTLSADALYAPHPTPSFPVRLQYFFPPSCVGEVGKVGMPGGGVLHADICVVPMVL